MITTVRQSLVSDHIPSLLGCCLVWKLGLVLPLRTNGPATGISESESEAIHCHMLHTEEFDLVHWCNIRIKEVASYFQGWNNSLFIQGLPCSAKDRKGCFLSWPLEHRPDLGKPHQTPDLPCVRFGQNPGCPGWHCVS